jgi:hypothetical protein
MGGAVKSVTKAVQNVAHIPGDVVRTVTGGGGSASPAPAPAPHGSLPPATKPLPQDAPLRISQNPYYDQF